MPIPLDLSRSLRKGKGERHRGEFPFEEWDDRCHRFGSFIVTMWIIYAVAASVCWGMSYAASSEILKKGFSPLLFFFGYSLFCTLGASVSLLTSGTLPNVWKHADLDRSDMGWFLFSIGIGALGAYLTYAAMSARNPTLASLIEISYPFFVVLFTWVFFRQCQLTITTMIGGLLLLAGVTIIILGER